MADIYEQQVMTQANTVSTGGQMGNLIISAGNKLSEQGQRTLDEARRKYSAQINNSAKISMSEAMETFGNDPERLSQELSKIRGDISGEIQDEKVKVNFLTDFDLSSQSYISKAKSNRRTLEREDTKRTLIDSMISADDMKVLSFQNLLSDDYNDDDYVNFMKANDEYNAGLDAKYDDGSNILSTTEYRNMKQQQDKTNAYATNKYLGSLTFDKQVDFANKVIKNEAMFGGRKKLSEVLTQKDYADLKTDCQTILNRYNNAMEKEQRTGREDKEKERIAVQVLRKREYENIYYKLKGNTNDKYNEKDFEGTNIDELLDYRNQLTADNVRQNINEKDFEDLMLKTTLPIMNKIEQDRKDRGGWFHTNTSRDVAFNHIDNVLNQNNILDKNTIAMMYSEVYNNLISEGIDVKATDSNSKNKAIESAKKVYQAWVKDKATGTPDNVAKVLIGRDIMVYNDNNAKPIENAKYQTKMDKDGNIWKVYPDNKGEYSDNSVMKKVGKAKNKIG